MIHMQKSLKVQLLVTVHQSDYERLRLEACRSGIVFEDYCALSMHLGMRLTQAWRENGKEGAVQTGERDDDCSSLGKCRSSPTLAPSARKSFIQIRRSASDFLLK